MGNSEHRPITKFGRVLALAAAAGSGCRKVGNSYFARFRLVSVLWTLVLLLLGASIIPAAAQPADGSPCGLNNAFKKCTNSSGAAVCCSQPSATGGSCTSICAGTTSGTTLRGRVEFNVKNKIQPRFQDFSPVTDDPFDNDPLTPDKSPIKDYPKPEYVAPELDISVPPMIGLEGNTSRSSLGMYILPATTSGLDNAAGVAVTRSSGYGVTDAAGLLAPGAKTANYTGTSAGGFVGGFLDLSGLVPANQTLLLRAHYGYFGSATKFGDAPDLGVVGLNIGRLSQDTHTIGSSVTYTADAFYVRGKAAVEFGNGSLINNTDFSSGSYSTSGYRADLRIGNFFTLAKSFGYLKPVGFVKAPPRPAGPAYIIGLDLSGHVGYRNIRANGFTDSAGFVYGVEDMHFGDVGARAKLLAVVPGYGLLWEPYVSATIDQRFGFSHTAAVPDQVQLAGGDLVTYSQAHTFWGVEGGLDVLNGGVSGWRVGAKGFYTASSDTNVTGGQLYLKIPLFQGPPVLR